MRIWLAHDPENVSHLWALSFFCQMLVSYHYAKRQDPWHKIRASGIAVKQGKLK